MKKRHPVAKVKGGWSADEDAMLVELVNKMGEGNWSPIARVLNEATGKDETHGRIGKQCRERWNHHLKPGINKEAWTPHEEALIVQAHMELGNRWSEIAKSIAGRSENAVKNHWNATLRRRDVLDAEPGPLKIYMLQNNITGSRKGIQGILQSNKKTGSKGSRVGSKAQGPGTPRKRAAQRQAEEEDFSDGGSTTPEDEDAASGVSASVRAAGQGQGGAEGCSSTLMGSGPGLGLHPGIGLPRGQQLNWAQSLPFGGLGFNALHGAFQGMAPQPALSPSLSLPPFPNHYATPPASRGRPSSHLTPPPPYQTQSASKHEAFGITNAKGTLMDGDPAAATPFWSSLPGMSRPGSAAGGAADSVSGAAMRAIQGSNAAALPRLPRSQSCSHAHMLMQQQQHQQHQALPSPSSLAGSSSHPDVRALPSLSSPVLPGLQLMGSGGTSSISTSAMVLGQHAQHTLGQHATPVPCQGSVGKQPFKKSRSDAGPLCTLPPPPSSAFLSGEGKGRRDGGPLWRGAGEDSEEDVSLVMLPQLQQDLEADASEDMMALVAANTFEDGCAGGCNEHHTADVPPVPLGSIVKPDQESRSLFHQQTPTWERHLGQPHASVQKLEGAATWPPATFPPSGTAPLPCEDPLSFLLSEPSMQQQLQQLQQHDHRHHHHHQQHESLGGEQIIMKADPDAGAPCALHGSGSGFVDGACREQPGDQMCSFGDRQLAIAGGGVSQALHKGSHGSSNSLESMHHGHCSALDEKIERTSQGLENSGMGCVGRVPAAAAATPSPPTTQGASVGHEEPDDVVCRGSACDGSCQVLVTTRPLPAMAALMEGLLTAHPQLQQWPSSMMHSLGSCGPIRVSPPALAACLLHQNEQQQQQLLRHRQQLPQQMIHLPKCESAPSMLDLCSSSSPSSHGSTTAYTTPAASPTTTPCHSDSPHRPAPHALVGRSHMTIPPAAPNPQALSPQIPLVAPQAAQSMFHSTEGAIAGLRDCLLGVCAAACRQGLKGIVIAVRLGTDTQPHEHSVLLGMVAENEGASARAAQLCSSEMGPLFG